MGVTVDREMRRQKENAFSFCAQPYARAPAILPELASLLEFMPLTHTCAHAHTAAQPYTLTQVLSPWETQKPLP
jgi:hypothetical protein